MKHTHETKKKKTTTTTTTNAQWFMQVSSKKKKNKRRSYILCFGTLTILWISIMIAKLVFFAQLSQQFSFLSQVQTPSNARAHTITPLNLTWIQKSLLVTFDLRSNFKWSFFVVVTFVLILQYSRVRIRLFRLVFLSILLFFFFSCRFYQKYTPPISLLLL